MLLSFPFHKKKKQFDLLPVALSDEDKVKIYISNIYGMADDLWDIVKRHPLDDSSLYSQARQIAIQAMSIQANHLYREGKHPNNAN